MQINGLAAFNADQMVGYLDNQEAEIYNLLLNKKDKVVINKEQDGYLITFEGRGKKLKLSQI